MRVFRRILLLIVILLPLTGCARGAFEQDPCIRKVAVVSLAVSNWRFVSVTELALGQDPADLKRVVQGGVDELLRISEQELQKRWQVVPVRNFIADPSYRQLAVNARHRIITPTVAGTPMPVFTSNIGEVLRGEIPPEQARDLCTALGVDAVVAIFSDWGTRGGGFSPTIYPMTKNVVTAWDARGKKRWTKRVDRIGESGIGRHLYYEVSEKTIGGWTGAFRSSLVQIIDSI